MSKEWTLSIEGKNYGPYSWEQLQEYAREGRFTEYDLVKSEEMENWVKAAEVPGLFATSSPQFSAPALSASPPQAPAPKKANMFLRVISIAAVSVLALLGLLVVIGLVLPEDDTQPADSDTASPPIETPDTDDMGEPQVDVPGGMKLFSDAELGFSIAYPEHWIYERPNNYTVLFSGPEGTEEYHTTINIQNLISQKAGGIYADLNSIYQNFKDEWEAAGGEVLSVTEDTIEENSQEVPFISMIGHWQMQGEEFAQWVILIERDESVFHQLSYTAPLDLYDDYFEVAEEIISTFDFLYD